MVPSATRSRSSGLNCTPQLCRRTQTLIGFSGRGPALASGSSHDSSCCAERSSRKVFGSEPASREFRSPYASSSGVEAGLGEQPREWTLLWFEAPDDDGDRLAEALSASLEADGGWYADFHSDSDVTVVFAGRVFRYRRGDAPARAEVAEYARSVGVPEQQLDWAE